MKISEMIKELANILEMHGDFQAIHLSERYMDEPAPYILSRSDIQLEEDIEYYIARGITVTGDCLATGLHR